MVAAYTAGYNKQKIRQLCSHCGFSGHTVHRCYKLHWYPQGYKQHNNYNKVAPLATSSPSQKNQHTWPRKENVANVLLQDTDGISLLDRHDTHMGTVTSDQVNKLLSVLRANHNNLIGNISQISGSTISLSDGTASTSKPQPQIILQTPPEHPPSSTNRFN